MKKIIALLVLGVFAAYSYNSGYLNKITAKASQDSLTSPDKIDILFIGNSYTFVNDMPTMLSSMARVLGTKHLINTHQITAGGATLETHWNNQTALNTIKSGEWDYIVFQGQSTSMLWNGGVKSFDIHLEKFMNEIKNTNSKVILFSTWARKEGNDYYKKSGLTYQQALNTIQNSYYNFAKTYNISVIYTGTLFYKANKININTYDSDGSHPNIVGSYIVALAFLKSLFPETKISCEDITQIVAINNTTCKSVNNIF